MAKKLYTVEDIKGFLDKEFKLDWKYEIIKDGHKTTLTDEDIKLSRFVTQFIVYNKGRLEIYQVGVSNHNIIVYGKSNQHKPKRWQKFIESKINQEQGLQK